MNRQTKAMIYAGAVVLCWSTVATAFKIALNEISYAKLLLIASFTALIVFGIDIIRTGKWLQIKQIESYWRFAVLGALNPFLYYLVLFKAYSLLPAQVAQPLNYSWQIVLLLLSVPFLGAKITRGQVCWMCVSFVGIILISMQGSFAGFNAGSLLGVSLALGSAFIWAFYWIFNSRDGKSGGSEIVETEEVQIDNSDIINNTQTKNQPLAKDSEQEKLDESVKLFLNFLFGFIYLLVYCSLFDDFIVPSLEAIFAAVYVGLFEMGVTFIFWAKALKLASNRASVISLTYLSPVLSMLLIHFILGENIYATTIVGFTLVIVGIKFSNSK